MPKIEKKKRSALSKRKKKGLSNYSLIPWEGFHADVDLLKRKYDVPSASQAIKRAVKTAVAITD